MSGPLSSLEAKVLIRLCESGRLYEVEAWLAAGKFSPFRKKPERPAESPHFDRIPPHFVRTASSRSRRS